MLLGAVCLVCLIHCVVSLKEGMFIREDSPARLTIPLSSFPVDSLLECAAHCLSTAKCRSISHSAKDICTISSSTSTDPAGVDTVYHLEAQPANYEVTTSVSTTAQVPTQPPCSTLSYVNDFVDCPSSKRYYVRSALRLASGKAILFLSSLNYVFCNSMSMIFVQRASGCNTQADLANIDPNGYFLDDPPDAAVGYIHSDSSKSEYYLIKGGDPIS